MDKATETRFAAYLVETIHRSKAEAGYPASGFRALIEKKGSYKAVVDLVIAPRPSKGFEKLWEKGRLDLSAEAIVLNPQWSRYFPDEVRAAADKRLTALKFYWRREYEGSNLRAPKNATRFSSTVLGVGRVYTRAELIQRFNVTDATINTGIFRPAGYDSIWLFVTEEKTRDRTQYSDKLDGSTLSWQGQVKGRKDKLVIEHAREGLELLVFYRNKKYEHPGAGFRFEGAFEYVSHSGDHPTSFVLRRRSSPGIEAAESALVAGGAFNPVSAADGRERALRGIVLRRGQPAFRRALLLAYDCRCALSGCELEPVLEAAHIFPYKGTETNHVSNGLLLRTDLHTLFDLRLFCVNDALEVVAKPALAFKDYDWLHGSKLRLPHSPEMSPSLEALRWHRTQID